MTSSKPIVFYDIASSPPAIPFSPNTWRTRYALNFKGLPYHTEWVDFPDIAATRKKLNLQPIQTFWDGTPFYTLPIVHDLSTDDIVGNSFDIALYLEKTYPDNPSLFPPSTAGLQAAFNKQVDTTFGSFAILWVRGFPLIPETAEKTKASFVFRTQTKTWEDLKIEGEARVKKLGEFKTALGELAKSYGRTEGTFLGGETPLYADLVLGAWLATLNVALKEWEEVQTWHDGLWGKIHLALEKYAEVK